MTKKETTMIDTILFDLDGTLLKMDQDAFIEGYFSKIGQYFSDIGTKKMVYAVHQGTKAMLDNDGKSSNAERFWQAFNMMIPEGELLDERFKQFYKTEFQKLKSLTAKQNQGKAVINLLKQKGYQLVLCTNPLFPQIATHSRIMWAGLEVTDFSLVTTFENSSFCKPNISYYREVLQKINKCPGQCLMVGNDVAEDLVVQSIHMKTFLVNDHLINHKGIDVVPDYQGSFSEFVQFCKEKL